MIANWILDEPNRALGARRVVAFERTRERRGQRRVITEYVVKNALTMRPV
jgi:Flp pilus assembly CpaF family ATPase